MDGQDFHHADEQPPEHGAPDVAHAPDHHGRYALQRDLLPHEGVHLLVVEREQHAAERGEQAADDEHHRHQPRDHDPQDLRGGGTFRDGAEPPARLRLLQQHPQAEDQADGQDEARQLRNADDQGGEADVQVRERQHHALQIGPPLHQHQVLEQDQEPHGAHQRHVVVRRSHPAIGAPLHHEGSHRPDGERAEDGQRPGEAHLQKRPGEDAREHEHAGDAEVQEVQDPDGQRERDRDQDVDPTQHQPVDELLFQHGSPRPVTRFPVVRVGERVR